MSNVAPLIETYFVAFTLKYGTDPTPRFGIDRHNLSVEIAMTMRQDQILLETIWYKSLLRAAVEVGSNEIYFIKNFADRYLEWLYAQRNSGGCADSSKV